MPGNQGGKEWAYPCQALSLSPCPLLDVKDPREDLEALGDGRATRWEKPGSPDRHVAGGPLTIRLYCVVADTSLLV